MANVRPIRRQNQGFAEVTDSDNVVTGGLNKPTLAGPPGGVPAPGSVTYYTNTGGFLVRTNSAGVNSVIGPLFTRVATSSAELVTALSSSDDIFIVAGAYSIDIGTFVLDTTPRTIWGAGMDKVTVTLTNGGAPAELDFTAGRTAVAGTILTELTLTSSAGTVTPALVAGLFGAVNVKAVGTTAVSLNGFRDCQHLVNCIATGFHDVAGAAGFIECEDLTNCKVEGFDNDGFSLCVRMVNCEAVALASTFILPALAAFQGCQELSDCVADYSATVFALGPHSAFASCVGLSSCRAIGPAAPVPVLSGFLGCSHMSDCRAAGFDFNFSGCDQVASSLSDTATFSGFFSCKRISSSRSLDSGTHGFESCEEISSSNARGSGTDGYQSCNRISGSEAVGNTGDGFDSCDDLAAVVASSNTGFGFRDCNLISAASAVSNTAGQQTGCTQIDLNTTNFPHIITPTTLAADADDYDLEDAQVARISASGATRQITGILASAHPSLRLDLINVGSEDIEITDQDVSSAAANRIITGTSATLTLGPDGAARLLYDTTSTMWRIVQA
jgi:hypothetical protein